VPLNVAVIGDSVMWGQGLTAERRFVQLALTEIGRLVGQPVAVVPGPSRLEPERGHARSGAKITAEYTDADGTAAEDKDGPTPEPEGVERVKVLLPGGGTVRAAAGDRPSFALTYRHLFETDQQMRRFLAGEDDVRATKVFGEINVPVPTAIRQVRGFDRTAAADVALVFLDGGANDVDFEAVLNPQTGPDFDKIDETIREVFRNRLRDLLQVARETFPRAVILVTGYYSVLSGESDRDELETLFEYLSHKSEWQLALNWAVQRLPFGLDDWINAHTEAEDIDKLVDKAIVRSVVAAAVVHFWTRHTIASCPPAIRGPGIVYAHPAFRPRHALFAREPLVHEGYKQPDEDGHVVADGMLAKRLRTIPRGDLYDTYRDVRTSIGGLVSREGLLAIEDDPDEARSLRENIGLERERLVAMLTELLPARADLPTPFLLAARAVLAEGGTASARRSELADAAGAEVGRIEISRMASFLHPAPAGARRYADRIVTAYRRHLRLSLRDVVRRMGRPGQTRIAVAPALRAHGVDPANGLRQLAPIALVESVAVRLLGVRGGHVAGGLGQLLAGPRLRLGPGLSLPLVRFVPAAEPYDLFQPFDLQADAGLADITEIALVPASEQSQLPRFDEFVLFLNGHEFFRARRDAADVDAASGAVRFRFGA
jgi:hypothetical protein